MKTLLLDNYDSFTYNLFQLLAEVNGEEPVVARSDEASWPVLARRGFDNVVVSPGSGRPDRERDFGVCAEAIRATEIPLLGVCLGHQGIGWVSGARVTRAPDVVHGQIGTVVHDDAPLFAGIPRRFRAVRYHSLCVEQPLPDELEAIAWSEDGVLMALAHRTRPLWGVQFHPESICTEHGRQLLTNFRDLTAERRASRGSGRVAATGRRTGPGAVAATTATRDRREPLAADFELRVERLDGSFDTERAFASLYGDRPNAFWLDSSTGDERSRFSFMGAAGGPLSAVVTYDVGVREVRVERSGVVEVHHESIFDYLSRELGRMRHLRGDLPFDFDCGFVGYFGYELKADCEGEAAHESAQPDAAFVFADRLIAFDHLERCAYLLCLTGAEHAEAGERWLSETGRRLTSLPAIAESDPQGHTAPEQPVEFRLSRSHPEYIEDIARCKELLIAGETYEICLTNRIVADVTPDPLTLYRTLRRVNPAPFSAFLRFGESAVLSSSPERFLSIGRDRWVEAKPIKGTCRRGDTPAEDVRLAEQLRSDEKSRAENLMITDLLRNDLGIVCEVGTVHVPHLIEVESYETVHQLVSTVRGRLRDDVDPPNCIRACFPGGSMTGAPKKRTMELIDELEGAARGVYSGAIGYLGLGGGCDLSVVIRTIVMDGRETSVGVGGAITVQSDPEDEYQEILLKGRAPMNAIDPRVDASLALERPAAHAGPS
jgi:para-aminobenzoate synthetase